MPWNSDVHITDVDESGGMYELEQPLVYQDRDGTIYTVPKGFRGDFSSFPSFVRFFTPVTILGKAPWLHDWLYEVQIVDRKHADRLYRDGARDEGMSDARSRILYLGLRIGGWVAWKKHTKKLK